MKSHLREAPPTRAAVRDRQLGRRRLSERLRETVHDRVTDVLPILEHVDLFDADDLCGHAFTARFAVAARRRVDLCIAELSRRGALPLEVVQIDADGPTLYRLIGGAR